MTKHTFLLLCLLWIKQSLNAQCPVAPLTLNSQAQVDAFPSNFPNCENLAVLLTITGNNITNLDGLSSIQTTSNSIILRDNPQLSSLAGLSNLTSIAVELKIENNDALTNLSGLDNLSWLGGHLSIEGNALLATLDGIGPIPSLGSYLNISFNPALTDITALNNLTEVGPNYFNGFLAINNNSSLPAINGLDLITANGSYFFLGSNPAMTTVNGLNGLTTVNGDFEIAGNPSLTDLNAFVSLTTIDGSFNVDNNQALTNLDEFNSLTTINGPLTIASNSSLSNCVSNGICDFLAGTGTAIISNNAVGCNSVPQVEAACLAAPVELTYFRGKYENESVVLSWQTASEKDNDYFIVEGSTNGHTFEYLGQVKGNGSTTAVSNYQYFRHKPTEGRHYFRLKQVDFDGHFEYSGLVTVLVESKRNFEIFPNPTTGPVWVKGNSEEARRAIVTDFTGRIILEKDLTESSLIDLFGHPKGIYTLEITTGNQKSVKKIVKQ